MLTRQVNYKIPNEQMAKGIRSHMRISKPAYTFLGKVKQVLEIVGRVMLGIVSLGFSECIIKYIHDYETKQAVKF